MNLGETDPQSGHISQRKKNGGTGNAPSRKTRMGMIVRKLSLWIAIIALTLTVKTLLGLSRFFDRLSQRLYKGIIPIINTLNKGDQL